MVNAIFNRAPSSSRNRIEDQDPHVKALVHDLCKADVGRMLTPDAINHAYRILTEHLSNWTFGVGSHRPQVRDRILHLSWVESGARGSQRSVDLELDLDSLIVESAAMTEVMES